MESRRTWVGAAPTILILVDLRADPSSRLHPTRSGDTTPLHYAGDLVLADVAIDAPVVSPAGTSITVAGQVLFNGPFGGTATFNEPTSAR